METYQSKERVLAVQVETIEKYTVNDDVVLSHTFVSQNHIYPTVWLISNGAEFTEVLTDVQFKAKWELDSVESEEPLEPEVSDKKKQ